MPAYLCAAVVAAAHPTAERWTTDLASFAARTGLREFAVRAYLSRRELGDPRRSTQLACSRQASRARTCRRSWTYRRARCSTIWSGWPTGRSRSARLGRAMLPVRAHQPVGPLRYLTVSRIVTPEARSVRGAIQA